MVGIAGGLAAGIIIGFLTAPDKGSEIRRKVIDQTGKLKDGLSKMLMPAREDGELKEAKQNESVFVS